VVSEQAFDSIRSASQLPLLFLLLVRNTFGFSAPFPFPSLRRPHRSLPTVSSLSPPTVALSHSRFHLRLNGGFKAGFRRNPFDFSAPLCTLSFSGRSLPTPHSLPTECRLRSGALSLPSLLPMSSHPLRVALACRSRCQQTLSLICLSCL
jgi:hypothetical protein